MGFIAPPEGEAVRLGNVDVLGRIFGNAGADDGEIFLGIGTGSSRVDKSGRARDQIAVPDDTALQLA